MRNYTTPSIPSMTMFTDIMSTFDRVYAIYCQRDVYILINKSTEITALRYTGMLVDKTVIYALRGGGEIKNVICNIYIPHRNYL